MKQEQIFEVMTHIDPALVEQADLPRARRRFSPLRAGLIAACLCAVLAGTALAAAEAFFGVRIGFGSKEDRIWYDVFLDDIQYFPVDSLSQEFLEMPKEEFTEFTSVEGAEELLGVELSGFDPFDSRAGREWIAYSIGDGPVRHTHCRVIKVGSEADRPAWVRIDAEYVAHPPNASLIEDTRVFLHVSAMLYTEEYTGVRNAIPRGGGSGTELTLGSFTASDGQELPMVHVTHTVIRRDAEGAEQGTLDFSMYYLYFIQDGILYEVEAQGNGLDEETFHAIMEHILSAS